MKKARRRSAELLSHSNLGGILSAGRTALPTIPAMLKINRQLKKPGATAWQTRSDCFRSNLAFMILVASDRYQVIGSRGAKSNSWRLLLPLVASWCSRQTRVSVSTLGLPQSLRCPQGIQLLCLGVPAFSAVAMGLGVSGFNGWSSPPFEPFPSKLDVGAKHGCSQFARSGYGNIHLLSRQVE